MQAPTLPGSTTLDELVSELFVLSTDLSGPVYTLLFGGTMQVSWPGNESIIRIKFEAGPRSPSTIAYDDWSVLTPVIGALSPNTAASGGAGFTLTVNGQNFVNGATVSFDAANQATTFVSSTQLTATILAASIATAKTVGVNVQNPDGTRSADTSFVIT
jgi:hypothetical protein